MVRESGAAVLELRGHAGALHLDPGVGSVAVQEVVEAAEVRVGRGLRPGVHQPQRPHRRLEERALVGHGPLQIEVAPDDECAIGAHGFQMLDEHAQLLLAHGLIGFAVSGLEMCVHHVEDGATGQADPDAQEALVGPAIHGAIEPALAAVVGNARGLEHLGPGDPEQGGQPRILVSSHEDVVRHGALEQIVVEEVFLDEGDGVGAEALADDRETLAGRVARDPGGQAMGIVGDQPQGRSRCRALRVRDSREQKEHQHRNSNAQLRSPRLEASDYTAGANFPMEETP